MKASLINKLDLLQDRYEELTALLGDGEVIANQQQFRAYSKEYAEVEPVIQAFRAFRKVQDNLESAQALLKDSDPDMREMAEEEVAEAKQQLIELEDRLQRMLLPKDPNDGRNVYLEVRRYRRRRGGDLLRRRGPHVLALRRAPRLAGGDSLRQRGRTRRL